MQPVFTSPTITVNTLYFSDFKYCHSAGLFSHLFLVILNLKKQQ